MRTLTVSLGARSYPIYVDRGLLRESRGSGSLPTGPAVVITDTTVGPLYEEFLRELLGARLVLTHAVPAGEASKSIGEIERIAGRMLEHQLDRETAVIALGGGVVGDLAGFLAAIYQRGIDFYQIPTTLLAQVDSAVGGKTAVNHPLGKNMLGAFHQPRAVISDLDTLDTLEERDYRAGLAEILKYGFIMDPHFLEWLEHHRDALRERDKSALAHAVTRSCAIKADIVASDERESGMRALLNFGHTFGHAIESGLGHGEWLHGEAVAVGMVLAATLSARVGQLSREDVERLTALIEHFGLPTEPPPDLDADRFIELMRRDKKNRGGEIRPVLLRMLGEAYVCDQPVESAIRATIDREPTGAP